MALRRALKEEMTDAEADCVALEGATGADFLKVEQPASVSAKMRTGILFMCPSQTEAK